MIKRILLTVSLILMPAVAQAACLSKSQARHKWPHQHLYWHTANHCWDNLTPSRHRRHHYDAIPPRIMASVPQQPVEEEQKIVATAPIDREIKILAVRPNPIFWEPINFEQRWWPEEQLVVEEPKSDLFGVGIIGATLLAVVTLLGKGAWQLWAMNW